MEIKYSIILPVYNVENYLRGCLESIVGQKYDQNKMQLIIVDDGSSDSSSDICKQFVEKYDFIEYHLKPRSESSGLGNARNFGMQFIKGEYFVCIDSDDQISPEMFKIFDKNLQDYPSTNLLVFDYKRVYENPTLLQKIYQPNSSNEKSFGTITKSSARKISHCAWNKLFKTSKYKDFKFINTLYEDIPLNKVLFDEDKLLVINDVLYYYLIRENSLMTQGYNENKVTQNIKNFKEIENEINPQFKKEFYYRFVKYGYIFSTFTLLMNNKDINLLTKLVNEMNELIKKTDYENFSLVEKVFIKVVNFRTKYLK